jgi:hypothetical protein
MADFYHYILLSPLCLDLICCYLWWDYFLDLLLFKWNDIKFYEVYLLINTWKKCNLDYIIIIIILFTLFYFILNDNTINNNNNINLYYYSGLY